MPQAGEQEGKSLYERLGGYDAIAAIVDEFLARMRSDPMFARFGGGRSLDTIQRTRQLIVDQMCALSGGPCVYAGRAMKISHAGLGITAKEWETQIRYAVAALDRFNVPAKEKAEFIALFEQYRDEIVEG